MAKKEVKKLNKLGRKELLEVLLESRKENEELKAENEELKKKVENREIAIEKAGSIAQAALELNGVFKAAQDAAEQYVANVARMADEKLKHKRDGEKQSDKTEDAEKAESADESAGADASED